MRFVDRMSLLLLYVGIFALIAMVVCIVADVIGRSLLTNGIPGANELEAQLLSIVSMFCLAAAQVHKRHILIDYLVNRLKPGVQRPVDGFIYLASGLFTALMTWQTFIQGIKNHRAGIITPIMEIPLAPFLYLAALGLAVLCVVFLGDFLRTVREVFRTVPGRSCEAVALNCQPK